MKLLGQGAWPGGTGQTHETWSGSPTRHQNVLVKEVLFKSREPLVRSHWCFDGGHVMNHERRNWSRKLIIINPWQRAYIRARMKWTTSLGSLPWYSQGKAELLIHLISLFLTQIYRNSSYCRTWVSIHLGLLTVLRIHPKLPYRWAFACIFLLDCFPTLTMPAEILLMG